MADDPPRLLSVDAADYGDSYHAHLLEQYKLFVDSAQRISSLRSTANNFLLAVNSGLVTLCGISALLEKQVFWLYLVGLAGVAVCITWFNLIRSYRHINTAKFKVIHELEESLPVALFKYEWHVAHPDSGKTHTHFTTTEALIPWVFALLYVALMIFCLAS